MFRCSNKKCRAPVEARGYCAPCKAEYRKQWIAAHSGYATAKRKEWAERNPEKAKAIEDRKLEKRREGRPPMSERTKMTDWERKKRSLENNPIQAAAMKIYKYALRQGKLERGPCAVCSATENIDGHHTDYTKPLDVVWLCKPHNREEHKRLRECV